MSIEYRVGQCTCQGEFIDRILTSDRGRNISFSNSGSHHSVNCDKFIAETNEVSDIELTIRSRQKAEKEVLAAKKDLCARLEGSSDRLALDTEVFEELRSLHRVVRAMHDGECPKCHNLFPSEAMVCALLRTDGSKEEAHVCPSCEFYITGEESAAVIKQFGVVMDKNVAIFEEWRRRGYSRPSAPPPGGAPAAEPAV